MTQVSALVRENHTPLFLDSRDIQKSDPIFRFENSWFLRDGIDKIVCDIWNDPSVPGSNIDRWQTRFRMLRAKLKG